MKKKLLKTDALFAAILLLALISSGCRSIYEAEYSYSEKFAGEIGDFTKGAIEIKNYANLQNAIVALVETREEQASFVFGSYVGSPADDLAKICYEIKAVNPLGNYALEEISYDTSRIVSYYTVDLSLSYKRGEDEIKAVSKAITLSEARNLFTSALENGDTELSFRCRSSELSVEYFVLLAEEYYDEHPDTCMVKPRLSVTCWPETGSDRIYKLDVILGIDSERAEIMRRELNLAVSDAINALEGIQYPDYFELSDEARKAMAAADTVLSLNTAGEAGQFPDTAYGLFLEHYASPEGLAEAYKLLCRKSGLECFFVNGYNVESGPDSEAYWNIVKVDGEYYHMLLDMSALSQEPYEFYFLSDEETSSLLRWETSEFPACSAESLIETVEPTLRADADAPEVPDGDGGSDAPTPPDGTDEPGTDNNGEDNPGGNNDPAAPPEGGEGPDENTEEDNPPEDPNSISG